MRICVGNIELQGRHLKYYVFGSRSTGYGVEITESWVERADQIVSKDFEKTLNLAQKLQRCSVFPANLDEIIEDCEI